MPMRNFTIQISHILQATTETTKLNHGEQKYHRSRILKWLFSDLRTLSTQMKTPTIGNYVCCIVDQNKTTHTNEIHNHGLCITSLAYKPG